MADAKINFVATDNASKVIANVRGEMAQAKESAAGLVTALTGLGVISGAGLLLGLVRGAVDAADNLRDLSQQAGISVESLGGLAFAASQSGGNLDSVTAAAGKLNKSLAEAAAGSKTALEPFKALGISVVDAAGKTKAADVVFAEIADRFQNFEDGPEKAALALRIFGKAGADQISLLNDGGDALRANIEYYKRFSGVTQEVADASDNFNDTLGKVHLISGALGTTIAAQALPVMQALADEFLHAKEEGGGFNVVAAAVRVSLETVSILGANVAFVFKGVGREIGAIAAQLVALGAGDFSGFSAISDAVKEDGVKARAELDALEKRIYGVTTGVDAASAAAPPKPKKRAPRLTGENTPDASAAQEAKAQLALDLENIKKASEAIQAEYTNNENILQALRGVGLVDDDAYYAAKRALVELNSETESRAYTDQIARLQQEKLAGKDKLENDKKIVEVQGKLAATSAKATTDLVILGIQEKGAVDARAASYLSARQAAEDYFQTLERGYARELASVGKGKQAREYDAGLAQVEDRFAQRRRDLENNRSQAELQGKFTPEASRQYDEQLRVLREYQSKEEDAYALQYTTLQGLQSDWLNGASEAANNYINDARNVAKQTEDAFTSAFKGAEDALVEFAMTGKLNFKSLAESIIADLIRIQIRSALANAVSGASGFLGSLFGGGTPAASNYSLTTASNYSGGGLGLQFNAKGDVYSSPSLSAFSNQVHDSPQMFAFAKGAGIFAEAGPEAIMPLTRSGDGSLGVRALGGQGGTTVNVVVENHGTDATATSSAEQQPDGTSLVRIILRAVADDTATGGITARATAQRFALKTA